MLQTVQYIGEDILCIGRDSDQMRSVSACVCESRPRGFRQADTVSPVLAGGFT